MSDNCPICQTDLTEKSQTGSNYECDYECSRSGKFQLSRQAQNDLPRIYLNTTTPDEKEEKVAVISHAIRKMQKNDMDYYPAIDRQFIKLLKQTLPTPSEQKDLLIQWVGNNTKALGDYVWVNRYSIVAILGARKLTEYNVILQYLKNKSLIEDKTVIVGGGGEEGNIMKVRLSYEGREYFENLKRGGKTYEESEVKSVKKVKVFQTTFSAYHYIGYIGEGGVGNVVKVEDEKKDTYALKYLKSEIINTDKLRRFKNELYFGKRNLHKNIIKVFDDGYIYTKDIKCPFYVMDYYSETLHTLMKDDILLTDILPYFVQILDGIEAAHNNKIWHRDIKPKNILFDSTTKTMLIADFGIAHFEEEYLHTAVETQARDRLANFQYAAPEQKIRGQRVDQRADIFALGMILNEMFTGIPPQGTDFQKISDFSPEHAYLDSLVDQMLKQKADQRPKDIATIKKWLIDHENDFETKQEN